LKKLEGVESVSVNLVTESAQVEYDPSKINLEKIIETIKSIGYGVLEDEKVITVKIGGMNCIMCAKAIEVAVSKLPVKSVDVNFSTQSARIVFDPSLTNIEVIKQAIESVGYQFLGVDVDIDDYERIAQMKKRLFFAATIGTTLLILTYGKFVGLNVPFNKWVQLILASAVMLYSGKEMFSAAVKALSNRILNMDVMYSMGIGSAFAASILSTFGFLPPDYLFFETSVLLLAFLMLGRRFLKPWRRVGRVRQ